MKLNNLTPAAGSTHASRRIGRGPGSGLGGTSTRGHKGAKARSGYKRKIGFEGGQMPLQRRVPKFGFKNINHKEYVAINLSTVQKVAEKYNLQKVGKAELINANLVSAKDLIKVLGNGTLTIKVDVEANAFSKSAAEAVGRLRICVSDSSSSCCSRQYTVSGRLWFFLVLTQDSSRNSSYRLAAALCRCLTCSPVVHSPMRQSSHLV